MVDAKLRGEMASFLEEVELSSPLVLLIAIGLIIAVVLIVVNIKLVLDYAPYAYPNAKIRAMQSALLSREKFEELAEAEGLFGVVSQLEKESYGGLITREMAEEGKIMEIEEALEQNLVETYVKIDELLPGDAKKIYRVYMKRFEGENIKRVLRGIYAGLSREEMLLTIVSLYRDKLGEALTAVTVEEAVARLDKTEYGAVLREALPEYSTTRSLLPLEAALDRYIYEQIRRSIASHPGGDIETIKKLVGTEIDIRNLNLILRAASTGVTGEEVYRYLVPYGYELSEDKLRELCTIDDVERIINELDGTSYFKPLFKALGEYDKEKALRVFEKALDEYYIHLSSTIATRQPFGLGPILGYIVAKEYEVKNLTALLRLKIEGFKPEEIKKALW
jgi:V/A-type H+-transporting ATPase subunit C